MPTRTTQTLNRPLLILVTSLCMSVAPLAHGLPALSLTKVLGGSQTITKASWIARHKVLTGVGASIGGIAIICLAIYWWRKPVSNQKFVRQLTGTLDNVNHDYREVLATNVEHPSEQLRRNLAAGINSDNANLTNWLLANGNIENGDPMQVLLRLPEMVRAFAMGAVQETCFEKIGKNQKTRKWFHASDDNYLSNFCAKNCPYLRAKALIDDDIEMLTTMRTELGQRAIHDEDLLRNLNDLIQKLTTVSNFLRDNEGIRGEKDIYDTAILPLKKRIEERRRQLFKAIGDIIRLLSTITGHPQHI